MTVRPLFVPLKRVYFEAFKSGLKTHELRKGSDRRWGEKHCFVGRPAILSLGYGKYERLSAVISSYTLMQSLDLEGQEHLDFVEVYGTLEPQAHRIGFSDIRRMVVE